MIWQPYEPDVIASLPAYCLTGEAVWRTKAPLICYEIVEWHLPDRVMRQFGLHQSIPRNFDTSVILHNMDLRGRGDTDWTEHHSEFIAYWNSRLDHIVEGHVSHASSQHDEDYMPWYRSITRRFIVSPPAQVPEIGAEPSGSIIEIFGDCVARIHALAQRHDGRLAGSDSIVQEILDLSHDALVATRQVQRLDIPPLEPPPAPTEQIPLPRAHRHPRPRTRNPRSRRDSSTTTVPNESIARVSTEERMPHVPSSTPLRSTSIEPCHSTIAETHTSTHQSSGIVAPIQPPSTIEASVVPVPQSTNAKAPPTLFPQFSSYMSFLTSDSPLPIFGSSYAPTNPTPTRTVSPFPAFQSPYTPTNLTHPVTVSPSAVEVLTQNLTERFEQVYTQSPACRSPYILSNIIRPPTVSTSATEGLTETQALTEPMAHVPNETVDRDLVDAARGRRRGKGRGRGRGIIGAQAVLVESRVMDHVPAAGRPQRKKRKPTCGT